jgi:two-component system sensor histidine kinase RstB
MRALFLQLWLMIFVVCSAVGVCGWVYDQYFWADQYAEYHEALLAGPLQAQGTALLADPDALAHAEEDFGYPATIMEVALLPAEVADAFAEGWELVWHYTTDAEYLFVPIPESPQSLRLGPLPDYPNTEYFVSAALILLIPLLGALAIRQLLRPVEQELRGLEMTAAEVEAGNLAARAAESPGPALTLARAINQMAATTAATIESQRELLRAVSHELRTPLARIQTAVHILLHVTDAEERERRLSELDHDFDEISELVDELLTYARLESAERVAGATEVKRELEQFLRTSAAEGATRGIGLGLETNLDETMAVGVDPRLFRRVIGNLMSNALRYAVSRVSLRAKATRTSIMVSVEDDGPGIPVADRERVFEPFVRLNRASAAPGYGVGLAIVRRVLERHHGRVWIEEGDLAGCRVVTEWPRA